MLRLSFERRLRKGTYRHNAIVAVHMPCIFCPIKSQPRTGHTRERTRHTTSSSTQPHAKQQPTNAPQTNLTFTRTHHTHTHLFCSQDTASQQLFHGPTPRSPLRRLSVRLRRSRSNTSIEYSLPGATFTQLSQVTGHSLPHRAGWSMSLFAPYC